MLAYKKNELKELELREKEVIDGKLYMQFIIFFVFYYKFNLSNIYFMRGCCMISVMVFNATYNNISVIPGRSVLLVEETGVPGENRRPAASH
jgi:hypothetical protein